MRHMRTLKLVLKEAWVGILNGLLVGFVAGAGMWFYAHLQHNPRGLALGLCVWVAMTASCAISGIAGTLVPLVLQRLGADPATASSIFLTTATDCCSMGLLLGLATLVVR
jgi:magnesium transporter